MNTAGKKNEDNLQEMVQASLGYSKAKTNKQTTKESARVFIVYYTSRVRENKNHRKDKSETIETIHLCEGGEDQGGRQGVRRVLLPHRLFNVVLTILLMSTYSKNKVKHEPGISCAPQQNVLNKRWRHTHQRTQSLPEGALTGEIRNNLSSKIKTV